jgi:ubiquinone/menaquinone biosynthesis C-methylase UbiE
MGTAAAIDLFDSTYIHFHDRVLDAVRRDTYGIDIGQTSWLTVDEYERWLPFLHLGPPTRLLEVASGSGGPALHVARASGCRLTGIDVNPHGVGTATAMARAAGLASRVRFDVVDVARGLPFPDGSFDALLCIDSINHVGDRQQLFREWARVLRPGGRAIFTDPVVVTGPVTSHELAARSAIGPFLFVPPGVNERLLAEAHLRLVRQIEATANATMIAGRWHRARARRRDDLVRFEGESRFEGLQQFLVAVQTLTAGRRLSRIAYLVENDRG